MKYEGKEADLVAEDLSYEEAIKRLEEIVTQLERGEIPLDQSMELFKEGMALAAFCSGKLQAMKEEMVKLVDVSGKVEPLE
jgi:exodeoxyribonuclease VII small subunit